VYYVELLSTGRKAAVFAAWLAFALIVNIAVWKLGHVHADPRMQFSLDIVWAFAGIAASIFASIIGCTLALENDGHLPVVWTKPFSRTSQALAKFAIDLAAIAFIFAFTCGAIFLFLAVTGLAPYAVVSTDAWQEFARYVIAPVAFFGLLQVLTSTLSRQAGMVVGLTWVALVALIVLSLVNLPAPFHAIVDVLNYANPLVYLAFAVDDHGNVITYGLSAAALALALIALIGGTMAIYRWQRSEA